MDWFKKVKFGVIIHWGIYSVPAFDSTHYAKYRKIQNGSEWYLQRLLKTWRVSKGDLVTQEHHKEHYLDKDTKDKQELIDSYFSFSDQFTGKSFNAEEWCKFFTSIGAKYIIFTAKHHDGFCMFETKTTEHNIMNTPLKRDVLKELREAAKKYKLKFGIYYSWLEFTSNMTKKYKEKMFAQIEELKAYDPDLFWLDGDWTATAEKLESERIIEELHELGIIVNSRLGKDKTIKGDYENYDDRYIPDEKQEEVFEACHTIGLSWGYNKEQTDKDYKTVEELKQLYHTVTSNGGNLLLNIAPDKDGNFDKIEKERLTKLALVTKKKMKIVIQDE